MSLPVARAMAVLVGWALLSAACAPAAAPASPAKPAATTSASAPTTVQMATLRAASDAGLFIALERGYFAEQGIDAQFAEIGLGSDIAAMLAAGQIQVGGAAITAGLLNAATRGVETKIV